jgi:ferredoxin
MPVREGSLVEFSCSLFPEEKGGFRVPCLGYLDAAVLTGAIVRGSQAVRLNIAQCKKCRFAVGLRAAAKSLRQANRILAIFGIPKKISASAKETSSDYNLRESELYSRRELFSYLRRKTGNRVAAAIEAANSDRAMAAKTTVTLEPRLPKKRSLLLEHIKKLGQPVVGQVRADDLPFAGIEISDRCNGCGTCVTFCPTGALRAGDQGNRQVIDFSSGYCLACGLCSDVCPEDAITYSVWLNPSDLVTDSRKILATHRKSVCAQCRQTYVAVSGNKFCPNCEKKRGLEEWLTRIYQPP